MKDNEFPTLLKIPEFSSALKVTQSCTRRWLLERKIASVRIGRLVRIPGTEVTRILSEGYVPPRKQGGDRDR